MVGQSFHTSQGLPCLVPEKGLLTPTASLPPCLHSPKKTGCPHAGPAPSAAQHSSECSLSSLLEMLLNWDFLIPKCCGLCSQPSPATVPNVIFNTVSTLLSLCECRVPRSLHPVAGQLVSFAARPAARLTLASQMLPGLLLESTQSSAAHNGTRAASQKGYFGLLATVHKEHCGDRWSPTNAVDSSPWMAGAAPCPGHPAIAFGVTPVTSLDAWNSSTLRSASIY